MNNPQNATLEHNLGIVWSDISKLRDMAAIQVAVMSDEAALKWNMLCKLLDPLAERQAQIEYQNERTQTELGSNT